MKEHEKRKISLLPHLLILTSFMHTQLMLPVFWKIFLLHLQRNVYIHTYIYLPFKNKNGTIYTCSNVLCLFIT